MVNILYGWLVEVSAMWGVRFILKPIKRKMLSHIQRRITVNIPERGHILHDGEPDRHIEFIADIGNPTPLELTVSMERISIINSDIPIGIGYSTEPIRIPRECPSYQITIAKYYPFLCPIGLPIENQRWQLKGVLKLHCYYGDWVQPITPKLFRVDCRNWEEVRNWILEQKRRLTSE